MALEACDTARGGTLLSDERLNLTRTFLTAGAASMLATRWKVPDEPATTRFLLDFYRGDPAHVWATWVLVRDAR